MISEEALVLMDDGRGPHTRTRGNHQSSSTLASSYIAHSNARHIGGVAMRDNTSLPFCFPSLNQVRQHNNIGSRLGQSIMENNHNHLINANNMRQSFQPIPYIQGKYFLFLF